MFTYIYHEKQRKMSSYFSLATVFIEDQGAQFFIEAFPEAVFSVGTARGKNMPFKRHPWTCRISLEGLKSSLCNKNGILPIGLNDSKGHHSLSPNVSNRNKFSNGSQYERKSMVHTLINYFLGIHTDSKSPRVCRSLKHLLNELEDTNMSHIKIMPR